MEPPDAANRVREITCTGKNLFARSTDGVHEYGDERRVLSPPRCPEY